MIVSNCPRCGEAIRVPADELPDDAYAQCPWCRDTFPVTDLLKNLPPVLELLSADGTPLVPVRHQAAAVGVAGLSEAASTETVVDDDTLESFDLGDSAPHAFVEESQGAVEDQLVGFEVETPNDTWGGDQPSLSQDELAPMKVSPRPARKSQGSGIGTAIKVVLGGVMAVPIAGGLLMAMGRNPDWGFWPFNGTGESNRNVVAAPAADLSIDRPQTKSAQQKPVGRMLNPDLGNEVLSDTSDPADSAREQIMAEPKAEDLSTLPDADPSLTESFETDPPIALPTASEIAMSEPNLADITAPDEDVAAPEEDGTAPEKSVESVESTINAPGFEMPTASADEAPSSRSEKPAIESPSRETETADAIPLVEPVTADDPAELVAIADRAGKMVEALSAYDGDPKERVRRMLLTYEKIAIACNLASRNSKALNTLATKIKNSPLLDEIGGAASEWLVYTARKSEGIVLVGQANTTDQGLNITLDSGTELSVVGDLQLPAAERVLAMGRIIDENSVELVLMEPLP